ncbi:VanZ like protein:RDD [Bacillus cereus BDRD-Cer4]|nr:VanZ like protein:RDD [Bacillus cereus BDRD-Cer4]
MLARKIVKGKRKCKLFVRNYVGNNNVSKYRMEQLIEH